MCTETLGQLQEADVSTFQGTFSNRPGKGWEFGLAWIHVSQAFVDTSDQKDIKSCPINQLWTCAR